ncbi:MAG: hypothetical protein LBI61_03590 [Puniceicoccales bacterium]|jgi:hypothetical protein|nr:hypothetical protein [Puniceicoccales bacterium]
MDSGKMERQVFVDMEKSLLDDKSGAYRKELVNKLLQYESEVNAMMHSANNDGKLFERFDTLKTAIRNAKETIEKF